MNCTGFHKQNGSALITALFVTAIAVILTTAITLQQRQLLWQATLIKNHEQSVVALQGTQDWARATLLDYLQHHPNEPLPRTMEMQSQFFNMTITAKLSSEQALFNLNDFQYPEAVLRFSQLIQNTVPNMTANQSLAITTQIATHPLPFFDKTELREIPGITAAIYNALAPFVTALPLNAQASATDINNAPWPIILTLSQTRKISPEEAKAIAACIQSHPPFNSMDNLQRTCASGMVLNPTTLISQFYFLRAKARIGEQNTVQSSLLEITADHQIKIIWQKLN